MSVNTYINGQLYRVGGIAYYKAGQSIQVNVMPEASASLINRVYQYIGATTENYTHGFFYECVLENGTYSWQILDTNPALDSISNSNLANMWASGGSSVNVEPLTANSNGVYNAPSGTAYNPVTVDIELNTLSAPKNGVYEIDTTGWDTVLVDVYEKYHELYTGGANMNPQICYFNDDVNTDNYDEFWINGQYMYTDSNKNIAIWNGRYPTSVLSSIYTNNGFIGSIGGHNAMWWRPNSTGKFMNNIYYGYDFPYALFGVKNRDRTEECLWANTGSTTPSTVTLSESIFDYDEICLYFVKDDGASQTSWYLTDELEVNDVIQGYDDTASPATLNKYTIASNTTLTVLSESGGYVLMGVYGVNDTSLSETTLYANPDPTTAPATVTLSDDYANYDEIVLIGHVPSEDTVCSYYYPVKILGRWTHDAFRDRIGVFSNQKSYWLAFTSNTTLVADANPTIILDKIIGIKRPVISIAHELIDVEPLSVNTNGIYTAPSGKAYSPVSVDVPEYVDGNRGIVFYDDSGVSPVGFTKADTITKPEFALPQNTACTVECCCNISVDGTYGRIWQIGDYNSVANTLAYNASAATTYFEAALHDVWFRPQVPATDWLNKLVTFSFVIGDDKSYLYANGTLISDAFTCKKSDIISDTGHLCFLHGLMSSRTTNGNLYALRVYHRALTAAEIQQNVQVDIYNFGTTT